VQYNPLPVLRRLLNLLTTMSLVLFMATAGACVRSYVSADNFILQIRSAYAHRYWLIAPGWNHGVIYLAYYSLAIVDEPAEDRAVAQFVRFRHGPYAAFVIPQQWRFENRSGNGAPSGYRTAAAWLIQAPFWFPLAITGLLPARAIYRRARNHARCRHAQRGLCPTCGYDLRATPERCPECGAIPTARAIQSAA
jgi:hypothetical protein